MLNTQPAYILNDTNYYGEREVIFLSNIIKKGWEPRNWYVLHKLCHFTITFLYLRYLYFFIVFINIYFHEVTVQLTKISRKVQGFVYLHVRFQSCKRPLLFWRLKFHPPPPNFSGMVGVEVEIGPEREVKVDVQNVRSPDYCSCYINIYLTYKYIFIVFKILQYLQNK